jgi:hypothetical protein
MIAVRARGDDIGPDVQATLIAREDVVYREAGLASTAVLAGIIVPSKYLAPSQFHMGAWTMNLKLQSNYRRSRDDQPDGMNVTPSVCHHVRFSPEYQDNRTARRADVDRLEIRIQDKDGFMHGTSKISSIIA